MTTTKTFLSFAPEVIADSSGWTGNALRFATEKEAEIYVRDLSMRWFAVRETRVVPSTDAPNYEMAKVEHDGGYAYTLKALETA